MNCRYLNIEKENNNRLDHKLFFRPPGIFALITKSKYLVETNSYFKVL